MSKRRFARNVLSYGLGQLATIATGLVYSVVTARVLGIGGKGELAIFTAMATVAAAAFDPGLRPAIGYTAARGLITPKPLLSIGFTAALITTSILVLFVTISSYGDIWFAAFVGACLARDDVRFVLQGCEKMTEVAVLGLSYSLLSLAVFVVLVPVLGMGINGAKAALVVALSLSIPIGLKLLGIRPRELLGERPSRKLVTRLLKFGYKAYPAWFFTVLSGRLELFVVAMFLQEQGAGLFSIVLLATELIGHVPMALGAVLFPRVASDEHSAPFYTAKCLRHTIALGVVATILCWLLAEPLVRFLYSEPFLPAAPAMELASVGWVFMGIRSILSDYFYGSGLPHWQSLGTAAYAALALVLSVLLVPRFQLAGAAAAQAVANFVSAVLLVVVYARDRKQSAAVMFRFGSDDLRDYGRVLQALYNSLRQNGAVGSRV